MPSSWQTTRGPRGAPDEALVAARKLLDLKPMTAWSHYTLHRVHLGAGRDAEARAALEEGLATLRLDKDRRELLWEAAWNLTEWGHPAEAEEAARRALDLEGGPRDKNVWEALGRALAAQDRLDEAGEAYERMRPLAAPSSVEARLAMLDLLRGDAARAERRLRAIRTQVQAYRRIFELLAVALAGQGRFDEAEPHARRVLAMSSERASHALLAWILVAGDLDVEEGARLAGESMSRPAHAAYPIRLRQHPYLPTVEHALGLAYLKLGRHAEAIPLLERAAALQPDREQIPRQLSRARRAGG